MQKRKAFSLIELLVVVAIMGLLAGMAVVALNQARQKARDARRVADVKQIQTALELYFMDKYTYPEPIADTNRLLDGACLGGDSTFRAVGTCGSPTYMGLVPSNPSPKLEGACTGGTGTGYTYAVVGGAAGSRNTYQLYWCVSQETGGVPAGKHVATPAGLVDGTF